MLLKIMRKIQNGAIFPYIPSAYNLSGFHLGRSNIGVHADESEGIW